MTSRRDLVKRFGIGALIAPIVGGVADNEAVAQLIEVPKIKPIEIAKEMPKPFVVRDIERVAVTVTMRDGTIHTLRSSLHVWANGISEITPGSQLALNIEFSQSDYSPVVVAGDVYCQAEFA